MNKREHYTLRVCINKGRRETRGGIAYIYIQKKSQ